MLRHLSRLLIAAVTAACAVPVLAAPPVAFQSTVAIDRGVAAFAGKALGEEGGARVAVDARLKLASCPMVSMAWRSDAHDAVVVTCTGPDWRIFVPIRAPVAAPKAAGALVITPSEVSPLRPVYVIKRGDPVTISAGSPGFSITRDGVAVGDAVAGGRFMVKVDDSRTPIQAVAVESGHATLPGWLE